METLAAAVIIGLFLWFVVYTAVRGAVGDLRAPRAPFRLTWTALDGDEGTLELVNLGLAPVFQVAVGTEPAGSAASAPLLAALMLQPGERAVAPAIRQSLSGGPLSADARVVYLTVRHRSSLEEVVAERRTRVPFLVPAADAGAPGDAGDAGGPWHRAEEG